MTLFLSRLATVAGLTEALKRSTPEQFSVTFVWYHMIHIGGGCHHSMLDAVLTYRLACNLSVAYSAPPFVVVQVLVLSAPHLLSANRSSLSSMRFRLW